MADKEEEKKDKKKKEGKGAAARFFADFLFGGMLGKASRDLAKGAQRNAQK